MDRIGSHINYLIYYCSIIRQFLLESEKEEKKRLERGIFERLSLINVLVALNKQIDVYCRCENA